MPEEAKKDHVPVEIGDLYQFMICECRYGYTRNNHLMPWGAFHHVYEYLPEMEKANLERAAGTACQLAEEAIDELRRYFFDPSPRKATLVIRKDGKEVDRATAVWTKGVNKFSVDWEAAELVPGMEYCVVDTDWKTKKKVVKPFLTVEEKDGKAHVKEKALIIGFTTRVCEPDPERGEGWYKSFFIPQQGAYAEIGKKVMLIVEKDHQIDMKDYCDFIDYCVGVADKGGRRPHNIADYDKVLKEYPCVKA